MISNFDPDANVVVTSGGTEALTASIMALAGTGRRSGADRTGLRFLCADCGGSGYAGEDHKTVAAGLAIGRRRDRRGHHATIHAH